MRRTLVLFKKAAKQKKAAKEEHESGGVPGENLPFGKSLGRPVKMTALFILYFGTGFWVPNIAFMYWMLK